jgi:uncharacterized membrane protein
MVGGPPSVLRSARRRRLRRSVRSWLQRSLLPIPTLYLIGAIVLGVVAPAIDRSIHAHLGSGSPLEDARDVLTATATGMIAFTGLVVASVLVLVQFAASQYSPRLVAWFRSDRLVRHAIGSFLAAPLFALVALRVLQRSHAQFAPDVTVATTLVLLIGAALLFLALLQRVIDRLRPRSMYASVARGGGRALREMYPLALDEARPRVAAPDPGAGPSQSLAHAGRPGVVTSFDRELLLAAAERAGVRIELVAAVGEFVSRGSTLMDVFGDGMVSDRVLRGAIRVEEERTMEQDPLFAIRIIVDAAIRALSAAINDPTTAVQGLDALEVLIRAASGRDLDASYLADAGGTIRLVWRSPSWEQLTGLAFDEIRSFGAGQIQVARRLRAVLEDLRASTPPVRHAVVEEHLRRLNISVALAFPVGSPDLSLAAVPDRMGLGLARSG